MPPKNATIHGGASYVVLLEQKDKSYRLTSERHFIPGVGLVREVLVSALNGKMVNRHEMVRQK